MSWDTEFDQKLEEAQIDFETQRQQNREEFNKSFEEGTKDVQTRAFILFEEKFIRIMNNFNP